MSRRNRVELLVRGAALAMSITVRAPFTQRRRSRGVNHHCSVKRHRREIRTECVNRCIRYSLRSNHIHGARGSSRSSNGNMILSVRSRRRRNLLRGILCMLNDRERKAGGSSSSSTAYVHLLQQWQYKQQMQQQQQSLASSQGPARIQGLGVFVFLGGVFLSFCLSH